MIDKDWLVYRINTKDITNVVAYIVHKQSRKKVGSFGLFLTVKNEFYVIPLQVDHSWWPHWQKELSCNTAKVYVISKATSNFSGFVMLWHVLHTQKEKTHRKRLIFLTFSAVRSSSNSTTIYLFFPSQWQNDYLSHFLLSSLLSTHTSQL